MPSQSSAAAPPLMQQQRHHGGLQGPRPATLKVTNNKADDMGLKRHLRRPVQQQQRQPVIIYVESPKVVHAHAGEFKSVVQRLTGAPAPSSALLPPPPLQFPFQLYGQLPLVAASSLSEMTAAVVAAPPAPSPLPFDDAAGGVRSGLGFFIGDGRQLISPAEFLYDDHQSTVAFAGPPSLGACYRRQPAAMTYRQHM